MALNDIEIEIGRRIEGARLAANISQAELAAESGVSRRTITRLENGDGVSLDTLIRVMQALGMANRFMALLPDPGDRPIDRVRLKGRLRQRARQKSEAPTEKWTWDDEPDGDEP